MNNLIIEQPDEAALLRLAIRRMMDQPSRIKGLSAKERCNRLEATLLVIHRIGREALACQSEPAVTAPRKLLAEAHAAMRAMGWHLAMDGEIAGDGVLESAAIDIEARFRALLEPSA